MVLFKLARKTGLFVDLIVFEEAPYSFPHDLGDGDIASIRVFHALLQLNVKAFRNDQTAISSFRHNHLRAASCPLKVSMIPILSHITVIYRVLLHNNARCRPLYFRVISQQLLVINS